jgi:hypothetical protein
MVDTSSYNLVFIDKILGEDGMKVIEHRDSWPAVGLRFREGTNESLYISRLYEAADQNPDKFEVFTHETMPRRWHFSNNERIAPLYVVPKMGHVITTVAEGNDGNLGVC